MLDRQKGHKLQGRIEMDDTYIDGERSGTHGRGAEHKQPFTVAVQTDENANPKKIHLRVVAGFRTSCIASYAKDNLVATSLVVSDPLACFRGVEQVGYRHTAIVCGGGKKAMRNSTFKWVNTNRECQNFDNRNISQCQSQVCAKIPCRV